MSKNARTYFVESMRCVSGSVPVPDSSCLVRRLLLGEDGRIGGYFDAILQNGQLGCEGGDGGIFAG